MNNVISLLRVSTDQQDCQRQRADMLKLKTKFGLEFSRTLELQGVSGTATLEDSQVQQILKDLELPNVDGIALSALDRLFRPGKRYGQFAILDRFVDEGKRIWSMREGIVDPATDEGYDKCISAGGRAGAEWRELIRRTHDGRIEHLKGNPDAGIPGKLDHGHAADGYVYIPKWQPNGNSFAINPERAPIIRMMYDWRRANMPPYRIARDLNNRGIRSARGGRWSRQTVLQTLRNPTYKGQHRRFGIIVPCPVIVEPDLWDEVQRINAESRAKHIGRPALRPILLRNLLWCGRCGRRCIAKYNGKKTCHYRCGNYELKPPYVRHCEAPGIGQHAIEDAAWGEIWRTLTDPQLLLELARAYYAEVEKPQETDSIEQEIARLRRRIAITNAQVQDEVKDYAEGRAEVNEMKAQIARLTEEMRAAGKVVCLPPAAAAEAAVREILDGPEPTTYEGRRGILEAILDLRMVYDDGQLTIEGKIPVPAESSASNPRDRKKCNRRVDDDCISFHAIPFILKRRVA